MTRPPVSPGTSPTPAEIRALRAYIDAGSVNEAARSLGVRPSTVKNHMANIRTRLHARTTAEVVLKLYHELAA